MRRKYFTIAAFMIFLGIVGGAATYSMALNAPYLPGESLFSLQLASERLWGLGFNRDAKERAEALLILLARRLDELAVSGRRVG